MTILYSWSATKCNRTISTYWVDHSPKGRRMEFIIETGLYRPRVKFLVMFEVVQTIYTQNMPQTRWANFLGKLKKGVVPMNRMILRSCKVTKEMADRLSVLLPSLSIPSFPLSLPFFSGSFKCFAFSCPSSPFPYPSSPLSPDLPPTRPPPP